MQGPARRDVEAQKKHSCKCRVWLSPLGQVELQLG